MADLKAKKAAKRYAPNNPSGVLLRKVKRKDVASKVDVMVGCSEMDIDNMETAGDGILAEQADSPRHKKMRTRKGDSKRTFVSSEKDDDYAGEVAGTTSLNVQVADSFWHKDFDFRRYESLIR